VGHRGIFSVFLARITKEKATMALDQSALAELLDALRAGGDLDFMREAMQLVLQALIDLEATEKIGAARYERTDNRTTHRNGSRSRLLSTKAGDVELAIPKLRHGSFFPALLEPRRRIDRALWAVIMEAFVHGVSTRKVDDLVAALGIDAGVSKSQVSRICAELDGAVSEFRERRLDHIDFPYVFVDATYVKAHDGARVVSKAIVVATGVAADGNREVLGLGVGDSEDKAFWTAFLRSLRARGLAGVRLVISDAHEGLRSSIEKVMLGAAWQRCRVHFMRNVLARVPRGSQEMVAAAIRTVFAQPDAAAVADQLDSIAGKLGRQFPAVELMLREAATDVCAFTAFPNAHWKKIWSTNPLERVNKEIKRRTNVVGIFPNEAGVLRLAGSILLEVHDEWQIAERRYLSESSMAKLYETDNDGAETKEVGANTKELLAG
jgi:transposase-like protein